MCKGVTLQGVIGKSFQEIRIELAVWGFIGSLKATLTYLNCESATTTGGKVN
jgi:hypothetical protein